ncbi:snRNA-activating protein complex subunit 3 [Thrips palmi]|uniref:snRNA-activating protein complex subunit 3 n=1 Tax=Thrips palmi TaxID=161013 RepID=A0A6P9ADL0_THRPL|nr:snRNA-activating protein complex subunit 3 [Thrips palmi]
MEKVYGCGQLDYTSEPLCLRNFFNDASLQYHPFVEGSEDKKEQAIYREAMMEVMDSTLTDSEFQDLEIICSADNFKVPDQLPQFSVNSPLCGFQKVNCPQDSEFETHHKLAARGRIHERFLKYTGTKWLDKLQTASDYKPDLKPGSELLVSVRLYAPFRHEVGKAHHRVAAGCQEIIALGSNTLADLKDSFACAADNLICQDLSSDPFQSTFQKAKDKYKSGMFYINETFYDDMRCSSNIEYSEQVLDWAEKRNLNLGKKAKMEHTKIIDLTVKLGYPYLYQHQGNCEHLFCFSDVRLLHQSDLLQSSKYPLLKSLFRQNSRYCMLCGHYVAKWLTIGNLRVPHDPCYFCQSCFLSYNYVDKEKIGSFRAFPFSCSSPAFLAQMKE